MSGEGPSHMESKAPNSLLPSHSHGPVSPTLGTERGLGIRKITLERSVSTARLRPRIVRTTEMLPGSSCARNFSHPAVLAGWCSPYFTEDEVHESRG